VALSCDIRVRTKAVNQQVNKILLLLDPLHTPMCSYPLEPSKHCDPGEGDPHPIDWHCTPCTNEGKQPCPPDAPCLFNVSSEADPLEKVRGGQSLPSMIHIGHRTTC
jgi:hypothetical protein